MGSIDIKVREGDVSKIKSSPFWFYHREYRTVENYDRKTNSTYYDTESYWKTDNKLLEDAELSDDKVYRSWDIPNNSDCFLVIAEINNIQIPVTINNSKEDETIDNSTEAEPQWVTIPIHMASVFNADDLISIFNQLVYKEKNGDNKFCFKELLFILDSEDWTYSYSSLNNTLKNYDKNKVKVVLTWISRFGKCLSQNKQECLKNIFSSIGSTYNVYSPNFILGAIRKIAPFLSSRIRFLNLFDIVSIIFGEDVSNIDKSEITYNIEIGKDDNDLTKVYYWINHPDSKLQDYQCLINLFCLLSVRMQKKIIDRYFYDIYKEGNQIDYSLLSHLKDNPHFLWENYRYCIYEPYRPINLSVSLYLDCILTQHRTQGKDLATFNGILDNVISKMDTYNPQADINLKDIIPVCNGGARVNAENFKGFINCNLYYYIKSPKQVNAFSSQWAREILDNFASKNYYFIHDYIDTKYYKGKGIFQSIKQLTWKKVWNGSWTISLNDNAKKNIFQLFLQKAVDNGRVIVTANDIDTDGLYEKALNLLSKIALSHDNASLKIKSFDIEEITESIYKNFLRAFTRPVIMRFTLRNDVVIGKDLFGLKTKAIKQYEEEFGSFPSLGDKNTKDILNKMYFDMEKVEVHQRVRRCLASLCKLEQEKEDVELSYDAQIYENVKTTFYFSKNVSEVIEGNNKNKEEKFLYSWRKMKYISYCAPELSQVYNDALQVPFYWCRDKQCFYASINDNETLADVQVTYRDYMWEHFDLLLVSEIAGYPLLTKDKDGNQPEQRLRTLISIVNKISRMLPKLVCKECGHLLFAKEKNSFNNYSHYHCLNPKCKEYKKDIYLNFCFKCKKGLIDSRDTHRCPNGLFICPSCLACCDDAFLKAQADKYYHAGRPIPFNVMFNLNHGHNDKGFYFCPNCGQQLVLRQNPHEEDEKMWVCENCGFAHQANNTYGYKRRNF